MAQKCFNSVLDLRQLYTSKHMEPDNTPQSLQNKVQWDIRFNFCRRANENIEKFTKDTFTVCLDEDTGLHYVIKTEDEQTKNHQMDQSGLITACMPEIPGNRFCPVQSFRKYLSKLHPRCDSLWQYPKETINDVDIWFKPLKIGPNPLSEFMSRLSHSADLSRVYTNHSIRVTGMTFLARNNFSPKQIMAITGHKSVNSLAIYQKVSNSEKLQMGWCMNYYINCDKPQTYEPHRNIPIVPAIETNQTMPIAIPVQGPPSAPPLIPHKIHENTMPQEQQLQFQQTTTTTFEKEIIRETVTTTPPLQPIQDNSNLIVPYEHNIFEEEDPLLDSPNFDLESILKSVEKENTTVQSQTSSATTIMQRQKVKSSPQLPIFNNCKIGNINIHIHKN